MDITILHAIGKVNIIEEIMGIKEGNKEEWGETCITDQYSTGFFAIQMYWRIQKFPRVILLFRLLRRASRQSIFLLCLCRLLYVFTSHARKIKTGTARSSLSPAGDLSLCCIVNTPPTPHELELTLIGPFPN